MKQFISHQSALEYWRRLRKLPENSFDRRCKDTLPDGSSKVGSPKVELAIFGSAGLSGLTLPIHTLVGGSGARRASKTVKQHVFCGETPVGCFMNIGNGLMVSSPEFCFLQMAGQLTLVKLIELGYELCGVYSLPNVGDPNVPKRGFYNRQPLTSVKKLGAFLGSMPGAKWLKKATHALRFLLEGSASPMETKLAMFLTLPNMLGGYKLGLPELNKRIVLPKTARKYFDKDYYVCDLFWPDKRIAVEYDSDQQHTGSVRIASDSARRNVLDSQGIRVVTVTKQQLYSVPELERAARVIAGHLERRLFSNKRDFYATHHELREQLLWDR